MKIFLPFSYYVDKDGLIVKLPKKCMLCMREIKKGSYRIKYNEVMILCKPCYNNVIALPTQILYKYLKLKKGYCKNLFCKNGNLGNTEIHHIKYHLYNPIIDTVELCLCCHRKISKL